MRPDEHKKKKNEQYKKKHGIKAKQHADDSLKHQATTKKVNIQEKVEKPKFSTKKEPSSSEEDAVLPHPHFERRNISSNWHRYEEASTDQSDNLAARKGADFKQLLANTATNLSQFRFKDEHTYEDTSEESVSSSSKFLTIDCDQLLTAVKCIPLNERLDIDIQHFETDDLNSFKGYAENNLAEYKAIEVKQSTETNAALINSKNDQVKTSPKQNCNKDVFVNETNELMPVSETNIGIPQDAIEIVIQNTLMEDKQCAQNIISPSILSNSKLDSKYKEGHISNNCSLYTKSVENKDKQIDSSDSLLDLETNTSYAKPVKQVCEDVDDLDKLLCLSNNKTLNDTKKRILPIMEEREKTVLSTSKDTVSLEDQLDDLLEDSVPAVKNTIVLPSDKHKGESTLEDWLDSVLDD